MGFAIYTTRTLPLLAEINSFAAINVKYKGWEDNIACVQWNKHIVPYTSSEWLPHQMSARANPILCHCCSQVDILGIFLCFCIPMIIFLCVLYVFSIKCLPISIYISTIKDNTTTTDKCLKHIYRTIDSTYTLLRYKQIFIPPLSTRNFISMLLQCGGDAHCTLRIQHMDKQTEGTLMLTNTTAVQRNFEWKVHLKTIAMNTATDDYETTA